jgi:predicted transcriptional regulator
MTFKKLKMNYDNVEDSVSKNIKSKRNNTNDIMKTKNEVKKLIKSVLKPIDNNLLTNVKSVSKKSRKLKSRKIKPKKNKSKKKYNKMNKKWLNL